jgi:hypothetical protein
MEKAVSILAFLGVIVAVIGIFLLPFQKSRKIGKQLFLSGLVFSVSMFLFMMVSINDFARNEGFIDFHDRSAARALGYKDARDWAAVRERLAREEEEARLARERQEEQAKRHK